MYRAVRLCVCTKGEISLTEKECCKSVCLWVCSSINKRTRHFMVGIVKSCALLDKLHIVFDLRHKGIYLCGIVLSNSSIRHYMKLARPHFEQVLHQEREHSK